MQSAKYSLSVAVGNGISGAGLFSIMGVADRATQPMIEFGAVQDDLFRMHRFDGVDRDREITGVLDVDNEFRPATWCNLPHGAELLATIGSEGLKTDFNFFLHDGFLNCATDNELAPRASA